MSLPAPAFPKARPRWRSLGGWSRNSRRSPTPKSTRCRKRSSLRLRRPAAPCCADSRRPMLILGIHSGWLDAGAALFDGYRPLEAMPLARLTGVARDGGRVPAEAVAECLAIVGARHPDRQRVVEGKGGAGRVDFGGRRISKKKNIKAIRI